MSHLVFETFLVLAGVGLGFWLSEFETRHRRGVWRPYNPNRYPHWNRYQIMRDCKGL